MSSQPRQGVAALVKRLLLNRFPLLSSGKAGIAVFIVLLLVLAGLKFRGAQKVAEDAQLDRTVARAERQVADYVASGGDPTDHQALQRFASESPMLSRTRARAEGGDPGAAYSMSVMYETGTAAPQDGDEAFRWLRKAAELGHPEAGFRLAVAYHNGDRVPKDESKAAEWMERAAEAGDPISQYNMYVYCSQGLGVPQDGRKAMEWLQRSAEGGQAQAQFALAMAYDSGHGVPRDEARAGELLRLAADQGHEEAARALGNRPAKPGP